MYKTLAHKVRPCLKTTVKTEDSGWGEKPTIAIWKYDLWGGQKQGRKNMKMEGNKLVTRRNGEVI